MIKFNTMARDIWIRGDNKIFDESELEFFSKEERSSLRFKIRPFTPKLMREVRERAEDKVTITDISAMDLDTVMNSEWQHDMLDIILVEWENVADDNGNLLECNKENKIKLFDLGYPRLGTCIVTAAGRAISRYNELKAEEQEGRIKNSLTSQAGAKEESRT